MRRFHALFALLAASAGCATEPAPCTPSEPVVLSHPETTEVDLLLMVDDSATMRDHQTLLADALVEVLPRIARGDFDGDGVAEVSGVSVHVGVVTSDMGAGPSPLPGADGVVPSCDPGLGDDGILRRASGASSGCGGEYPAVFELEPTPDLDGAVIDAACVAQTGTGGCGFEQQLEAMLKAVAPGSGTAAYLPRGYASAGGTAPFVDQRPPTFAGGGTGHGDGLNSGFVRAGSVLALLLLSDEDDCSVPDYSIFYRDPRYTASCLCLRCYDYAELLYPVERYVENLVHLRADPRQLVYAVIGGVPEELAGDDYDTMLADPRMIETLDPSMSPPTRILSACANALGYEAKPARRMVEVARGLSERGARTTAESICAADFTPALGRVAGLVRDALHGGCLDHTLAPAEDGTVDCEVTELLAIGAACDDVEGAEHVGVEGDRELCRVRQLTTAELQLGTGGPGWAYEPTDASCGGARVTFAGGHHAAADTEVRIRCASDAEPACE